MSEGQNDVGPLEINVKTMDSKVHSALIPPGSLICDLKLLLKGKTAVPEDRQRLIYRGRVLEDNHTVESYNISSGSTVHMVARPENYRELQQGAMSPQSGNSNNAERSTGTESAATNVSSPILEYIFGQSLRGTPSARVTGSSTTQLNQDFESLEPIWQGLLSMHTLLSVTGGRESGRNGSESLQSLGFTAMSITPSHARASVSEGGLEVVEDNQSIPSVNNTFEHEERRTPSWNNSIQYFEGQWLDVKDTVAQWLEATVLDVDVLGRRIFVHYNGWPPRWDEWLPFESPRVAPFRSMTRHTTVSGRNLLSPEPVTRLASAPRVGEPDHRLVLPELARMLRLMQPIVDEAASIVERSTVMSSIVDRTGPAASVDSSQTRTSVSTSSPTSPTPISMQQQAQAAPARHSPWSSPVGSFIPTTPGDAPDANAIRLAELSNDLCPLLDRMGRLMTDYAPHLRNSADHTLFGATSSGERNSDEPPVLNPFRPGASPQEMALASLLRPRPPSPEPERAFRQPIVNRSGLSSALSSLGSNGHLDITLSILSPRDLLQMSGENRNNLSHALSSLNSVINSRQPIAADQENHTASANENGSATTNASTGDSGNTSNSAVNQNLDAGHVFAARDALNNADTSLSSENSRSAHISMLTSDSSDSLDSAENAPESTNNRRATSASRSGSVIRSLGRMLGFGGRN